MNAKYCLPLYVIEYVFLQNINTTIAMQNSLTIVLKPLKKWFSMYKIYVLD